MEWSLQKLKDIFPGLKWADTRDSIGSIATSFVPMAGPIRLAVNGSGAVAMWLPDCGLFKKEVTLSMDSAIPYLQRWADGQFREVEMARGFAPRAELESALTALRERMRWQDVADDCPDACVDVQVYSGHVQDGWLAEDGYFRDHDGMRIHNVTYWRPIDHPEFTAPEAPNV